MKRLFLTVMAVLSMTMTFAEDENLNTTNNMQAYNMDVNYDKLGDALDLTSDQLEAVKDVHQVFCANMMSVAAAAKESRPAMMRNAINMDLRFMRSILTHKQYKHYLLLLNTTLVNRGLR
ncbi:MAG: hypothetical protein K5893_08815 [Prevotella sp.]|nr:hypothetical protein [Prevotella sp.]